MSIPERYARATRSSHLEVKPEEGDIDVVMAAGMVRNQLGVVLQRIRSDFDAAACGRPHHTLTRRLAGLRRALEAVDAYAQGRLRAKKYELAPDDLRQIVDQTVDVLLAPACVDCKGRGHLGGFGGPQPICGVCKGSRKRKPEFNGGDDGFDFGGLYDELSEAMHKAAAQMGRKLQNGR